MKIKIKEAKRLIAFCILNQKNFLLVGIPGVGKTSIVKQVCKDLGVNLRVYYPALDEAINYIGFPVHEKEKGMASMVPFDYLDTIVNADAPTLIFFDDLGMADDSVQKALMHILLARHVGLRDVSENVTFGGATNDVTDRAGVSGLLEPVKGRFSVIINIAFDPVEWKYHEMERGLPMDLLDFIHAEPSIITEYKPTLNVAPSCQARTVSGFGDLLLAGLPEKDIMNAAASSCGDVFASKYIPWRENYRNMPNIEAILAGDESVPAPDNSLPGIQYAVAYRLGRKFSEETSVNILKYLSKMPPEFGVMAYNEALNSPGIGINVNSYPGIIEFLTKNANFIF